MARSKKTEEAGDRRKQRLNEKQKLFLEAFTTSACNISVACRKTNISRQTYYDWIDKSDTFKRQCEHAREDFYDFAESKLHKLINEGTTAAIIFFCKTKLRNRGYNEHGENLDAMDEVTEVVIRRRGSAG